MKPTAVVPRSVSAALLALVLGLSACVPGAADETAGSAPSASPGARAGGTLAVGITPPDGIDPTDAHEPSARLIAATMCDTLVALDPVSGALRPSLAESWTITAGGRKLFVKLRAGQRFHNGRTVSSDDVVFTLSRMASEAFASSNASLVSPIAGYALVHGDTETSDPRLRTRLAGVSVIDERSVEITLDQPFADFVRVLADPATAPVSRAAVEADPDAFARAPVCAGPYRVAEAWTPGGTLRLERHAEYRGGSRAYTAGGRGYADAIEFRIYTDRDAQLAAFADGAIQLAQVAEDKLEAVRARPDGAVSDASSALTEFVGFPTTVPPFDDARVRMALSRALDRTSINEVVFSGGRVPADGFFPPTMPEAARADACGSATSPLAQVADARRMLAEADVDLAQVSVPFYFNDDFSHAAVAREVARQLKAAVGLTLVPRPLTFERYLALGQRPQGFDGMFRFSWAAPTSSPDAVIAPLFTPNGIGKDNFSLFGANDLDAAMRDARKAIEPEDRVRAYQRAEDILCEQMPMAPLLFDARATVVKSSVASAVGGVVSVTDAQPILRELYIAS